MADSDDDAPPPLSSLPDQLEALRLMNEGVPTASSAAGTSIPVASAILVESKAPPAAPKAAVIKKGFFDAKPKPRAAAAATSKAKASSAADEGVDEVIDLTRLRKEQQPVGSGPKVPDFMMLPPDEQALKYAQYKSELLEVLKPTEDTVQQISKDPTLLAGFDDPEVMRAVNDIAANPQNFKKYSKNAKVMQFYQSMGKMMGGKLDKMGASAPTMPAS